MTTAFVETLAWMKTGDLCSLDGAPPSKRMRGAVHLNHTNGLHAMHLTKGDREELVLYSHDLFAYPSEDQVIEAAEHFLNGKAWRQVPPTFPGTILLRTEV